MVGPLLQLFNVIAKRLKLSGDDYAAIDAALRAEGLAILDQLEALDGERESADGERESATPRDA